METKEIKRGDLLNAFSYVKQQDENTKTLLDNVTPLLTVVFGIIVSKIEDVIFGGEEE